MPYPIGLSALAGLQFKIEADSQATPEERSGGPADERHANPGAIVHRYPSQASSTQAGSHGPYGPENQMLDDEFWFMEPAGVISQDPWFDRTPSTRAAPSPRGIMSGPIDAWSPDAVAEMRRQSAAVHAVNTGAGLRAVHSLEALNDEWHELVQTNPGNSELSALPRQSMSSGYGWGTTSREQSFARQNDYGFDSSHQRRRWADGSIPGNNMWMRPGGRPLVKSLIGPARPPIGADSPFADDDLGSAYGINGAILQNVPTEYTAVPQPNLATPTDYAEPGGVDFF